MTNPSASTLLGKFIWYDQMSNDLPGAEKFYSKIVGWTLAPNTMNDQRYTLLQAGSAMIGGLMPIPEDAAKMGVRPAWMGYIAVDDVKAYADKVKAAGGAIHRPRPRFPMSARSLSRVIRAALASCCSKATASRRLRRIPLSLATLVGMSCTAATRKARSRSTRTCSVGRREKRWIWAPWGNIRSSPPRANSAAA